MCTDFMIEVGERGFVNGRTMEFALDLRSRLLFRGPGHHYDQRLSGPQFGYSWVGEYGFVGVNVFDLPLATDGLNSEGLSAGLLWLPGTEYPSITDPSKGLSGDYLLNWVLSSFATCADVRRAIEAGEVQLGLPKLLSDLLPLHIAVHDAQGNNLVIEFIGGEVQLHDNPVGVLTNAPPFEWQLQNLRNYVGLTPWDRPAEALGGLTVAQTGHGSGFLGLPGDGTPPSRFVRAAMMVHHSFPAASLDEATSLAFHILNTVDIPNGTARFKNKLGALASDYQQWAAVKDLTRKIYSIRFYDSPMVYRIELDELDLKRADGKQLSIPSQPMSIDLTAEVLAE